MLKNVQSYSYTFSMRRGTVNVWGPTTVERVKELQQAFAKLKFLPVRAEHMLMSDRIEYQGYSPYMEVVERGQVPPMYAIEIEKHKNGNVKSAKFVKEDWNIT